MSILRKRGSSLCTYNAGYSHFITATPDSINIFGVHRLSNTEFNVSTTAYLTNQHERNQFIKSADCLLFPILRPLWNENESSRHHFLPTFLKKKSPLCLSVRVSLNNFWTNYLFYWNSVGRSCQMKVTSAQFFSISWHQPFQNGARSNVWGGWKTYTSQQGNIKFCMLIDFKRWTSFNKTIFVKTQKYESRDRYLFYGDD
jgi:hypothetical protein